MTAFTDTGAYGAVRPDKVNDAVGKFADAAVKFTQNFQQGTSAITSFCTRLGGLSSAAAGVIGILQMTGVIKDPTIEMLKEIINILHDIQDKLVEMDKKLDKILKQLDEITDTLKDIQIQQKWSERYTGANTMLTNWNNFNSLHIEPLNKLMDEYTTKINDTMRSWWGQNHTSGVRVLVTTYKETEVIQTYSLKAYSEGFPDKADNGETVNKDWSIGVPAEYIPKTSAMTFNVNTYREDFKKAMVERLKAAVADNKLDGGSAFVGNAPNDEKLYEQYAEYVMNAIIYEAACYKMSHDSVWVTSVVNAWVVVKGKGEYAGAVSVRFVINLASNPNPDIPSFNLSHSSSGCNATGSIGVMLGLVFVMKKKLRRR